MGRRKILFLGAPFTILAGVALILVAVASRETGPRDGGGKAADRPEGPEIVLSGVEMREIGKEGTQYRLAAGRVSYLVRSRVLSAGASTLYLPGASGGTVVRAPKAAWEMGPGRITLAEGGTAENGAGWSAAVPEADLSLPRRVMTAAGPARLSGPGLSVTGDNLVWRWREGKLALSNTNTLVESPGAIRPPR